MENATQETAMAVSNIVLAKCGGYNGIENPLLFFRRYLPIPLIFSSLVT